MRYIGYVGLMCLTVLLSHRVFVKYLRETFLRLGRFVSGRTLIMLASSKVTEVTLGMVMGTSSF